MQLKNISDWNVLCVCNRLPIKGVISGVALDVSSKDVAEKVDAVIGARRLTRLVDRVSPLHPFFLHIYSIFGLCEIPCKNLCAQTYAV